ncbi:MAG: NAD(P)/FAD-dependent oxidoreductase [Planctomycetales bacterium]|nr:NAD(P)/FAD-dependent oxidoreductase [Planctomycetales bacterium]
MLTKLESTLSRPQAAGSQWDVIVVGAGVAGSLVSLGLARLGRRILLIERAELPRPKVCGACLNSDAIDGLRRAGVWPSIEAIGGHSLHQYSIRAGTSRAVLSLPGGHAVSRLAMDHVLTKSALTAGAELLTDTAVTICQATSDGDVRTAIDNFGNRYHAKVMIAANGLTSKPVSNLAEEQVVVDADSRIGLGAHWTPDENDRDATMRLAEGVIYMAVGQHGYVGMVLTEGGSVNLAAAVDRSAVQSSGPAGVCDQLLRSCGWDLGNSMLRAGFRGTQTLTRRRALAGGHRLFFAGDSSGYVEPFTGEGMAWAIRAAMAVVPWADASIDAWRTDSPVKWTSELKRLLGKQQRRCRLISKALRHPTLVRHTVRTLSRFPSLGRFAVEQIQRERSTTLQDRWPGNCGPGANGDAA